MVPPPNTDLRPAVVSSGGTLPRAMILLAAAWILAAGAVVASRSRADWGWYMDIHRTLAARGVPDAVRNLDSLMIFVGAAALGAWLASKLQGGTVAGLLCLRRGRAGWGWVSVAALAPMVVGGLILGWQRRDPEASISALLPRIISGVVRAPIAEEFLFRGLLIGVCAVAVGWRGRWFWCNAFAAACLFASIHISWSEPNLARTWPTLLVTGMGGLWYAWLLARWGSLWMPMVMHAGMNLGWMLAAAGGGAGGGGWIENVLRAATIALATAWTFRSTRGEAQIRE
ncbi:MAG: CPBP family intramembrane metalloprotease [Phycisphaerae bacterium]|nr:CPBP family intramembrane metalloprotease [Phycisphaerae bacterium]